MTERLFFLVLVVETKSKQDAIDSPHNGREFHEELSLQACTILGHPVCDRCAVGMLQGYVKPVGIHMLPLQQ